MTANGYVVIPFTQIRSAKESDPQKYLTVMFDNKVEGENELHIKYIIENRGQT
jgi:hypothetical protein